MNGMKLAFYKAKGNWVDIMVAKILANAEALKLATAPIIGQYQRIVSTK